MTEFTAEAREGSRLERRNGKSLMRMRIVICLVAGLGILPAVPVPAAAQLSDTRNAAESQYPDMPTRDPEPAPSAAAPAPAPASAPAPADDGGLPVTGLVAIPLLVTGALMLLVGGVMHVRTRDR